MMTCTPSEVCVDGDHRDVPRVRCMAHSLPLPPPASSRSSPSSPPGWSQWSLAPGEEPVSRSGLSVTEGAEYLQACARQLRSRRRHHSCASQIRADSDDARAWGRRPTSEEASAPEDPQADAAPCPPGGAIMTQLDARVFFRPLRLKCSARIGQGHRLIACSSAGPVGRRAFVGSA